MHAIIFIVIRNVAEGKMGNSIRFIADNYPDFHIEIDIIIKTHDVYTQNE